MRPEDMFHDHARKAARVPQPGETLFAFERGADRFHCELRQHAVPFGIEATFYQNGELLTSRRFDARLDPTRTPRELAVQWAEAERVALETGVAS